MIKMAVETERKFLVRGDFRHLAVRSLNILQTYLSIDRDKTIRLRIADDKAFITVKSRPELNSISRGEWEFPISVSDAGEMMKICLPGKIEKTRYIVPYGRHTFEVDVFHDKNEGLIIAEIELSYESEKFEIPEWLGEEVTGKPEYYNANLIK
jgi:adenylate cyclase